MVYLFTALPFLIAILAAVATIGWVGVTLSRPAISVFALLAVLIAFSGSTYGQLELERTIYSRGTGQLYFSFVNYYLWGAGIVVALRNAFNRSSPEPTSLAKYFAAFMLMIIGNAFVAGTSGDPSLRIIDAFDYKGLLNIINMGVLFYIAVNVFSRPEEARSLLRFLLIAIGCRGIFGMVRWAFLGGDSANVYGNFEQVSIKLTFFDISDGFLASFAIFCSAWLLYFHRQLLSKREQYFLWVLLLLEIAVIVFSFRRSSLAGMGLVSIFFITLLPARRRLAAILLAGAVLLSSMALLTILRLGNVRGKSVGFLHDIMGDGKGEKTGSRLLEYTETWRSLGDYWLFGRGMWGKMQTNLVELSYHFGDFSFVHNGFGHILLKSGVIGVLLFLGLLGSFTVHYLRVRKDLSGDLRLLADAGAAGVLFWLPTFLIGTPIIEFRTMLLLGLALALPFAAVRTATVKKCHAAA
jgi:hypothetical protein